MSLTQGDIAKNNLARKGDVTSAKTALTQSTSLARTRAALGRVMAGTGNMTIACTIADSNTRGTGSADATVAQQGWRGWPVKLAAELKRQLGVNAACEGFFGAGGYEGSFATNDDRIVLAGGVSNTINALGGKLFAFTAAGSLTFTCKTGVGVNTADLWFVRTSGSGVVSWSVDGGAATNLAIANGTSIMGKLTIPLGTVSTTHVITLTWVSGTTYFQGLDCYDNTSSRIHVWNMAWHGSKTPTWVIGPNAPWIASDGQTTGVWAAENALPNAYAPDLIVGFALATNDWSSTNNVSLSDFELYKRRLLNAVTPVSDVMMLSVGPSGAATAPNIAGQQAFIDVDKKLAAEFGLVHLNEFDWMFSGSQAAAETAGLYRSDHLHKSAAGHMVTARKVAQRIIAAA